MTKYVRQIARARAKIAKAGTLCTWYKPGERDTTDPTPEFPELALATAHAGVPIVLVPATKLADATVVYDPNVQTGTANLLGYIPGDCDFTPEEGDGVVINGSLTHVNFVNTTQPDGIPILHEIGFK